MISCPCGLAYVETPLLLWSMIDDNTVSVPGLTISPELVLWETWACRRVTLPFDDVSTSPYDLHPEDVYPPNRKSAYSTFPLPPEKISPRHCPGAPVVAPSPPVSPLMLSSFNDVKTIRFD